MAISVFRDLASEFRADLRSGKAVPALSAGFTSGLGLLVAQVDVEYSNNCAHGASLLMFEADAAQTPESKLGPIPAVRRKISE